MPRPAPYARLIEPLAPGYDPRHIEAFMRAKHRTLDGLYPDEFAHEVTIAKLCVDEVGQQEAESLACSMGL